MHGASQYGVVHGNQSYWKKGHPSIPLRDWHFQTSFILFLHCLGESQHSTASTTPRVPLTRAEVPTTPTEWASSLSCIVRQRARIRDSRLLLLIQRLLPARAGSPRRGKLRQRDRWCPLIFIPSTSALSETQEASTDIPFQLPCHPTTSIGQLFPFGSQDQSLRYMVEASPGCAAQSAVDCRHWCTGSLFSVYGCRRHDRLGNEDSGM